MNGLPASVSAALDGLVPQAIWEALRPKIQATRRFRADALDAEAGCRVTLVSETGQHTGSFKFRAAMAVALHAEAPRLLTASSGNFGAALAAAASATGKACTVVMPDRSAAMKIAAVRRNGATVDLIDTTRITREARVSALAAADPLARRCSPYDDPYVICGNALLGAEIFATQSPDAIIAPVGGGGLTSGLCVAAALLQPGCEVFGAEPSLANDAARSLREGRLIANATESEPVCDGARTRSLGQRNFAILRELLEDIVEVPETQIARAMGLLKTHFGLRVEPTGALGLAAILTDSERFCNRSVVCVASGGNVDDAIYDRLVP